MSRDGYSEALILSEGRYESRARHREVPEVEIEVNNKSKIVRVSERVVKKVHSDLKHGNITKEAA